MAGALTGGGSFSYSSGSGAPPAGNSAPSLSYQWYPNGTGTIVLLASNDTGPADHSGTIVALSDTPAAVQKTIQAQVGDGKMGDITKSPDGEDTDYDVDLTAKDGTERDFTVAQDGSLLSTEVMLAETPAAVQKTIQTELAGGSLDSIDKNLDDTDISYEVQGTGKDGKDLDFTVDDDGSLDSMEVELGQTPDAVQKTITAQLNGGKVSEIDENFDDDGTNFDVIITTATGEETSFNLTLDGAIDSKEIAFADVPPRVRATITKYLDNGAVLEVDKQLVRKNTIFPYYIVGRKNGKSFNFYVAPKGRFLGMDNY